MEGGISEETYWKLYPTGAGSPKFYQLPKIQKVGIPLRPIVSGRGTVPYEKSPNHVHNTRDFVEQIKDIRLH